MFIGPKSLLGFRRLGGIETIFGPSTGTGGNQFWNNYCVREVIDAAEILDISGSQVRLTMFNDWSGGGQIIDSIWIGYPDNASLPDFNAASTEIYFGGTRGVNIAALSTEVSDWTSWAYDGSSRIMISYHTDSVFGPQVYRRTTPTPINSYIWAASADDLGAIDGSNYGISAVNIWAIDTIEVQ